MVKIPSSSSLWAMQVPIRLSPLDILHLTYDGSVPAVACFLSALQLVASQMGKRDIAKNAVIHTQVHIGQPEKMEGFGLRVDIQVEGIDDDELIEAGHKVRHQGIASFPARRLFIDISSLP